MGERSARPSASIVLPVLNAAPYLPALLAAFASQGNLRHQLHNNYKQLEARLEEKDESTDTSRAYVKQNKRYVSSTDPAAAIVNRGKPKLSYQVHRAVDGKHEIITATEATAGDINEAHLMIPLMEQHKLTTGLTVDTVVADSKYGTIDNFLACRDRGIQAHMPDLRAVAAKRTDRQNIFTEEHFRYSSEEDVYYWPAGQKLTPRSLHMNRQSRDYGAPKKSVQHVICRSSVPRAKRAEPSKGIFVRTTSISCVMQAIAPKRNETSRQGSISWSVPLPEARDTILLGHGGGGFGE